MQNYKFSYDKENDDLFLFNPKSKSKGSIELGNIVIDFNNKKELVGIQIINASSLIKDLTSEKKDVVKKLLNNLKKCKVDIKNKSGLLIIKMFLQSGVKKINPAIQIPSITESSPALAMS